MAIFFWQEYINFTEANILLGLISYPSVITHYLRSVRFLSNTFRIDIFKTQFTLAFECHRLIHTSFSVVDSAFFQYFFVTVCFILSQIFLRSVWDKTLKHQILIPLRGLSSFRPRFLYYWSYRAEILHTYIKREKINISFVEIFRFF